jgi:hypothetical protein
MQNGPGGLWEEPKQRRMGFDMWISCNLSMCQETGRHYFLRKNGVKEFDLTRIPVVPEEFRRFIQLRGSVLYEYTRSFPIHETTVDAMMFLERFPPWMEIEQDEGDSWTSLDHNKFFAAIEWFAYGDATYLVSWSY